jgi:hypothetical protein
LRHLEGGRSALRYTSKGKEMTVKGFISDLWLAFGVLGMAIGLAAPFGMIAYLIYLVLS